MNELKCLPQDYVVWGTDILAKSIAKLHDYDMKRPITFTVEPLEALYRTHIEPNVENGAGLFSDLPPHVPDFAVQQALDSCFANDADSIIALGGGSVLDAAKAVSHFHQRKTGRYLPIVALPTTLSGSEFSHYFGITETNGTQKFKRSYAVRETVPRLVVMDPVLIQGTPRLLLLSSAIKSIDHAVEGMRKIDKDHPHAIMAASGVKRFFSVLMTWPDQHETNAALERGLVTSDDLIQLQLAAWQCYFYPASVIYGLSHRIGHILGGTFGLPHSATSCITLPPVVSACSDFYGDKLRVFTPGAIDPASALSNQISHLVQTLKLQSRLRDFGLERSKLSEVASLLTSNYADEVSDLGIGSSDKLNTLLEGMW